MRWEKHLVYTWIGESILWERLYDVTILEYFMSLR